MQTVKTMAERALLLISSSVVNGYGYLEHPKKEIIKLLGQKKVKTVLFVPYALPDHDQYTAKVSEAMAPWGYKVEGIHTKDSPIDAIKNAEAIFIGGGNTFVLLKTLYDLKLVDAIRERVLKKGIPYMGSSAGSNVATRSMHTTNDMPMAHPPTFDALQLVPFNINPHYLETDTTTGHKGETRDERLNSFLFYHKRPVLGLREGSAVLVHGDKAILVGDQNAKLFRPKKVKTILFVPYALFDHDKYTATASAALTPWGYKVEGIHTKVNQIDAIKNAEAIFIGGGNTFVLLKTLYDLNLMEPIREQVLKKGTPYMGTSAGTNVATRSINITNDMPLVHPPSFEALNLLPYYVNTHYVETDPNTKQRGETRDERIGEFVTFYKKPVLGLREGAVLLVQGNKATLLGQQKVKLFRPDQEPIEYEPNSDLSFLLNI